MNNRLYHHLLLLFACFLVVKPEEAVTTEKEAYGEDRASTQLLRVGHTMTLHCKTSEDEKGTDSAYKWYKGTEELITGDKYIIKEDNDYQLEIKDATQKDVGEYSCKSVDGRHDNQASLVYLAFKNLPKSQTVLIGDKLKLICDAKGNPTPTVVWLKDGEDIYSSVNDSQHRLELEKNSDGVIDAILNIENAQYDDRAFYECQITIKDLEFSTKTFIRIKDMYAAVWPFLGICAEVLVLCAIIFIYEKRRAKNDFDESDNEPEETKSSERADSVRQRK